MNINPRTLSILAGCLLIITCILYALSNALPLWRTIKGHDILDGTSLGLWEACTSTQMTRVCSRLPCSKSAVNSMDCGKFRASGIILIFACIFTAMTAVCLFIAAFKRETLIPKLFLILKILAFISLLCGIIGVSIGIVATGDTKQILNTTLSASVYIGISALILNLIGAIMTLLIK